ncbi:glycosyltransferase [Paenibacillus sp. TH7-28]
MAMVTVVITLYNKERYIEQAIRSVIHQTYTDWELLIIDDASTDASLQKVRSFNDSRIRTIALPHNIGQTHVLNYALTRISTPYFVQLDADDWLDQNALQRLAAAAQAHPQAALIYGNHLTYWLDAQDNVVNKEPTILEQYKDRYDLLLKMSQAMVPRFYRADAVREAGGWMVQEQGDMLAEDVQITLRLAGKYPFVWVNEILYHRRRDPANWKKFEETRPLRRQYRYELYNQILREWGGEYLADWRLSNDAYYLQGLIPAPQPVKEEAFPRYTIIIPNFNHESSIVAAVQSAIRQTLPPESILVIDDASTDRSLARLDASIKDPKIRVIRISKNSGISAVLNAALPHIQTPYFIQLDGDDWLDKKAAEKLVTSLHRNPKAAFAFADHRLWERNAEGTLECVNQILQPAFETPYDFLLKLGYMVNPRCYRTASVREVGGWLTNDPWEGRYFEDARMIIRLAAGYSWIHVPELLHNVRINRQKSDSKIKYYNHLRKSFYEETLKQWGDHYNPVWRTAPTGRIILERLEPRQK